MSSAAPRVQIRCQGEASESAELGVFCYTVHGRWDQLVAGGVSARLQLASMYAATSTLLPDLRAGMTGSEKAMELVRRCFVNHPLSPEDQRQLLEVLLGLAGSNSALALLCGDLFESSTRLHFLHSRSPQPVMPPTVADHLADAATAYRGAVPWNVRQRLTASEESRILGGRVPGGYALKPTHDAEYDLQSSPVSSQRVQAAEDALLRTRDMFASRPPCMGDAVAVASSSEAKTPYPLQRAGGAGDALKRDMYAELDRSWKAHQLSPPQLPPKSPASLEQLHREFIAKHGAVSGMRELLEDFLKDALVGFGGDIGEVSCHIQRIVGLRPTPTLADLPRLANLTLSSNVGISADLTSTFNPFLSEAASREVSEAVSSWLRLCVLEDKLERLKRWSVSSTSQALLWQELQVYRTWNPTIHPKWLAFEADARLQIRPAQAEVAMHMIRNPGDIVQLNMGEGKTRVILPLLVLHWAAPSLDAPLVRLHFLDALIGEAYDYLHGALTGTLLGCPLFLMPFHRDVQLTRGRAELMRGSLERCRRGGGAVLVTPEHRQSLYLKGLELIQNDPDASAEMKRMEEMLFRDILDESDELLHHRKQLIYAVGTLEELPARKERVEAVQALLRVLKHRHRHRSLEEILSHEKVAVLETSERPEQFGEVRLLPGPALDDAGDDLRRALLDAVLADPPYAMRWLAFCDADLRAKVVSVVLDQRVSAHEALDAKLLANKSQWAHLMAFRGLLAHGTLLHCLQMRSRVNYGISRIDGAKKRLAIPFRASNTPAGRSEFQQSDLAIILTTLSYYYDGISAEELREALVVLLGMAQGARVGYYTRWLAEVEYEDEDDADKINDVNKVDLTNESQLEILHVYLGGNTEAINFWLTFCVLPAETRVSPSYIATNAWLLAENHKGLIYGFSGTNDNHRIWPLQVRKNADGSLPSLASTNGKMLDLIHNNERYVTLGEGPIGEGASPAPTTSRELLRLVVQEGAHALVDCGALLGSMDSAEAAIYLLSEEGGLPRTFPGVVYFRASHGTAAVGDSWMVLDRVGRCMPLAQSPLKASEAFCIYDEARCRGADLRLSPEAKALLTVGPRNGKDKVMQAAGRLRMLGRSNQSIVFVGTPDVTMKIREVAGLGDGCEISSDHVLEYIMANSVQATQSGLTPWAYQGLHFSKTFSNPERSVIPEVLSLDEAYGGKSSPIPVAAVISAAVKNHADVGPVYKQDLVDRISLLGSKYGEKIVAARGSVLGGECERELELEIEEEEEVERQVLAMIPRKEDDWKYAAALSAESPRCLSSIVKVMPLEEAWSHLAAEAQLHMVSKVVFCTQNFLFCTDERQHSSSLGQYFRPVDAALVFNNGEVLLLSDREADGFLLARSGSRCRVFDLAASASATPTLVHLSYTTSEQNDVRISDNPLMRDAKLGKKSRGRGLVPLPVGAEDLASIWVFGGITDIPEHAEDAAKILIKGGKLAIEYIVTMRGHEKLLPMSDLEALLT